MGDVDFSDEVMDTSSLQEVVKKTNKENKERKIQSEDKKLISCLKNEKIIVRFIPREGGLVTDPKHVLYGGLGVNSKRRFVVPRLRTGVFKNPLTNSEKDYLEYIMGLPENALSIYKSTDNY